GEREVDEAVDPEEHVVDVVSDSACEAAERLQLLCAGELLLEPPVGRDVDRDADDADDLSACVAERLDVCGEGTAEDRCLVLDRLSFGGARMCVDGADRVARAPELGQCLADGCQAATVCALADEL